MGSHSKHLATTIIYINHLEINISLKSQEHGKYIWVWYNHVHYIVADVLFISHQFRYHAALSQHRFGVLSGDYHFTVKVELKNHIF